MGTARPVFRKFGSMIVVLGTSLILSVVSYIGITRVFLIRQVEVVGSGIGVQIDEGQLPHNLLFFPSEKIERLIAQNNPLLSLVRIQKKYPGTLIVNAVQRIPTALVVTASQRIAIDTDGMVLGTTQTPDSLPVIALDIGIMSPGDRIDTHTLGTSVSFIEHMKGTVSVKEISVLDRASFKVKTEQTDIFIPQQGDASSLSDTLQNLLVGFRIRGTMPTSIDLRFDKPVVTFD